MKVNNLLKDIRGVVENVPSDVSDPGFATLRLKIIDLRAAEESMEKQVFDLQTAHRQLIRIGQLGPKGKAQYEADLQNTQLLTRLLVVRKKRKKDQPTNLEEGLNIVPVTQAVHEGNVLDNMQECHGVCLPAKSPIKRTSRQKLESHQTKLLDFGTRRIDLRLRNEEVNWLLTECALRPSYT